MAKEFLEVLAAIFALLSAILGYSGAKMHRKIKRLQEEIDYLKWNIHRETSGVNPDSGRLLISEAEKVIRIFDINALAPLHHSREALIEFLKKKDSLLQIVLFDPDSEEFVRREREERDLSIRIFTEWTATLTILKDIQLKSKGTIELYLYGELPDRYLLIADAVDEEDLTDHTQMLVNYYPEQPATRGYTGEQFLAEYVRERDRDSIYKNLRYFNGCLEKAKRVDLTETYDRIVGVLSRLHAASAVPGHRESDNAKSRTDLSG